MSNFSLGCSIPLATFPTTFSSSSSSAVIVYFVRGQLALWIFSYLPSSCFLNSAASESLRPLGGPRGWSDDPMSGKERGGVATPPPTLRWTGGWSCIAEPRGSLLEDAPPDGGGVATPPPVAGGPFEVKRRRGTSGGAARAEAGAGVVTPTPARSAALAALARPRADASFCCSHVRARGEAAGRVPCLFGCAILHCPGMRVCSTSRLGLRHFAQDQRYM